jgi:hypothetical protein
MAEAGGKVAGEEEDAQQAYFPFSFSFFLLSFLLIIGLTSGPFCPCQQPYLFFATSALTDVSHLSDLVSICNQCQK